MKNEIKYKDLSEGLQLIISICFIFVLFSLVLWIIFINPISNIKDLPHKYCENKTEIKFYQYNTTNLIAGSNCFPNSEIVCEEGYSLTSGCIFIWGYFGEDLSEKYKDGYPRCMIKQTKEVCEIR